VFFSGHAIDISGEAPLELKKESTSVADPPEYESVSQRYGSGSVYHQAKKERKTLITTVLWLLFDLQKVISIKQETFLKFSFLLAS
jgi:hypothetical protein